jgi:hypothetical protein
VFVPVYSYTVAEHDPSRPWIVVGEILHLSVELEADDGFYEWASREWPRPRYEVQLDPWQLSPRTAEP